MALMHKGSSNNEGAISTFFERINLKFDEKIIDALFYSVILYAFHRINCLKEGLILVVIVMLLNKTIYGSFWFKWLSKKKTKTN